MEAKTLINFSCTVEKKSSYTAACKDLGVSVSDVCRRALDNSVALSEKLKTLLPKKKVESVADTKIQPWGVCPDCGLPMVMHDGSGFCPAGTEEGGGLR